MVGESGMKMELRSADNVGRGLWCSKPWNLQNWVWVWVLDQAEGSWCWGCLIISESDWWWLLTTLVCNSCPCWPLVAVPAYVAPDLVEPPAYTYQYGVNDDYSGANFQQTESRDGYGPNKRNWNEQKKYDSWMFDEEACIFLWWEINKGLTLQEGLEIWRKHLTEFPGRKDNSCIIWLNCIFKFCTGLSGTLTLQKIWSDRYNYLRQFPPKPWV